MSTSPRGPSQRQLRVGEVIRQRLSEALRRGDFEARILKKTSITVTEVRISPDLRQASVYVMPLGGTHLAEIVARLNDEVPRLKKAALGGLHLKYVPNIKFLADDTFEQAAAMDQLLDSRAVTRDLHDDAALDTTPDIDTLASNGRSDSGSDSGQY